MPDINLHVAANDFSALLNNEGTDLSALLLSKIGDETKGDYKSLLTLDDGNPA